MNYIKINKTKEETVDLYYEDHGKGRPVVLVHGWPLSNVMWEYQKENLIENGYRVVTYDRRGFGKSSRPWNGYDYDTMAGDLHEVIEQLDLHNVTLVGFSMGGGEVARYIGNYGKDRIAQVVLLGSVTPFLLKTDDNPEGVDKGVFDDIIENIKKDRIGFLDAFGKTFFGADMNKEAISKPSLEYYRNVAGEGSARATIECTKAFAFTDFRKDLEKFDLPTLIIHGKQDQTVPIEASGDRSAEMIRDARYKKYDNAPHGFWFTHKDQLNEDLLSFVNEYQEVNAVNN